MSKSVKLILRYALTALVMLIPTYIAIANYAVLGSWQNTLLSDGTVIRIQEGTDGALVFKGTEGEENNLSLAAALADMLQEGTILRKAPETETAETYTVTADIDGRELVYFCHFRAEEEESYLFDRDADVTYAVDTRQMLLFLQGFFYGETHESLSVPVLTTAGNEVIPYYISWAHKNEQGNFTPITNLAAADEEVTYPVNKNLSLRFSTEPDVATVTITNAQGETIFHGDYSAFTGMSFEDSTQLTVQIQAKWNAADDADYYGEATYRFYVNYSAQPAFAISAIEAEIGNYIVLNVLNASSPEDITFTCTPEIGCTPVFYDDGDYVRALVPLSASLAGGVYRMTVSTRGAEETFEVTLKERSTLTRPYDAGTNLINTARSQNAIIEYNNLLREIGRTKSTTKYFNGKFVDYQSNSSIGAILMLGYGHTRTLTNGDSYRLDGVDFVVYKGTDVPALNSGMVIAAGNTAFLGNYVIVDHGLGLRTWYCHLSEISVSVGDTVTVAQAVGKSGDTGFTTGSGVYLICTIGDTPISPYTLWENGVILG